jgi:hypothetical protein
MLTLQDREAAKNLVGYCEACDHYTYFNTENDPRSCEKCTGKFSSKSNFQLTTQRTFNSEKLSKLQKEERRNASNNHEQKFI